MVRINPSVTLELRNGQMVTIDLDEAQEIIKGLTKLVYGEINHAAKANMKKSRKEAKISTTGVPSETKMNEIIRHINKKISKTPRTLSNLLKGVSYAPNHLPAIRQAVESQKGIDKKIIGKRTYYYLAE
ncbi:MAG TPA: hypothetical protein VNI77_00485 [Nitrososphaera sp.]|nr:hypothetical protein [Nitrososphaera sp.]